MAPFFELSFLLITYWSLEGVWSYEIWRCVRAPMQGSGGDAVSRTDWGTFPCAGACSWLRFLMFSAFASILLTTFVRCFQEIETVVRFDPLHCPLILWAWSEVVGPFTWFMERIGNIHNTHVTRQGRVAQR